MAALGKLCTGLAALAFIMAVITAFVGQILFYPHTYSNATTNLALLALCFFVGFKEEAPPA